MTGEEKRKARKKAQNAIPLGMCQHCGAPATDRHHPDHQEALKVICLCRPCHLKADAEVLRQQGAKGAAIRWKNHTKEANCLYCGKLFTKDRSRQMNCSRSCGNKLAAANRHGGNSRLQMDEDRA